MNEKNAAGYRSDAIRTTVNQLVETFEPHGLDVEKSGTPSDYRNRAIEELLSLFEQTLEEKSDYKNNHDNQKRIISKLRKEINKNTEESFNDGMRTGLMKAIQLFKKGDFTLNKDGTVSMEIEQVKGYKTIKLANGKTETFEYCFSRKDLRL